MSEALGAFLTLSIALLAASPSLRSAHWIAMGALCGTAILARMQLSALLLPVAWLVWTGVPRQRRGAALGTVLLSVVAILAPWCIRNYLLVGEPLFSFSTTRVLLLGAVPELGDVEKVLHVPVDTLEVAQLYAAEIASKFLGHLLPRLPLPIWWVGKPLYGVFLCLAAGAAVYLKRRQRLPALLSRFVLFVLFYAFMNLLVVSFHFDAPRFFVTVQPLVAAAFAATLSRVLHDHFSSRPRCAMAWAVAITILCVCLSLLSSAQDTHRPGPPEPAPYHEFARGLDPNTVVASDLSYLFSLHAGTLALRLPLRPAELLEIHREYLPIDFVVLSGDALDPSKGRGLFGSYAAYAAFIDTPEFRGAFRPADPFPDGSLVFRRR
jgi:phosphate starvation-inducible membrane PsiE